MVVKIIKTRLGVDKVKPKHFDNVATSKFDDVLLEHGGQPHVLPLAFDLKFAWLDK